MPPPTSTSPVQHAIDRWHEILRGPAGAASAESLQRGLGETRLVFGDRPICRVLRPYFLTREEADRLTREATVLMRALRHVRRLLDSERTLRALLHLEADEEALVGADRQRIEPDAIARVDGFLVRGGAFQVVEYNAESPGGIAFGDTLAALFRRLPVFAEFSREFELRSGDGLANTLDALRRADAARRGPEAALTNPSIAIVDWKHTPTRREFEICAEYFERHGCPSRIIEPNDLRYEGGRLRAGDFAIDVVYKRVLVKEILDHGAAAHPLARAVADGAVACAPGLGVLVMYRKELFALLWDDRVVAELDDEERECVRRCVPWTHIVEDVSIERGGRRIGLIEWVRANRERLVIKPTTEYGGSGVVLGWTVGPDEWEAAIRRGLAEPHIAQERVTLPTEEFPVWGARGIAFERFYADVNPFVWNGTRADGFGSRLASGELLNVTAGGGSAVPVFIVERR